MNEEQAAALLEYAAALLEYLERIAMALERTNKRLWQARMLVPNRKSLNRFSRARSA